MTSLTLTNDDGTYSVVVRQGNLTAQQFVDDLVRGVMLAAGYHPKSVDEAIPKCDDCASQVPDIEDEEEDEDINVV